MPCFARVICHVVAKLVLRQAAAVGWAAQNAAGGPDFDGTWLARAQRHVAEREYRASENAEGLQAPNRRHAIRTYFGPTGIRVIDRVAGGSPELLALRLARVGRPGTLAPVAPGRVAHDGPRVEIRRDHLVEWYVNGPSGLEHGFALAQRPEGEGPLLFDLELDGARASQSNESVRIATATGRKLVYAHLTAIDAAGAPLRVGPLDGQRRQPRPDISLASASRSRTR